MSATIATASASFATARSCSSSSTASRSRSAAATAASTAAACSASASSRTARRMRERARSRPCLAACSKTWARRLSAFARSSASCAACCAACCAQPLHLVHVPVQLLHDRGLRTPEARHLVEVAKRAHGHLGHLAHRVRPPLSGPWSRLVPLQQRRRGIVGLLGHLQVLALLRGAAGGGAGPDDVVDAAERGPLLLLHRYGLGDDGEGARRVHFCVEFEDNSYCMQ